MRVAKMQILRWMSWHTLRAKIRNKDIRKGLGVANIKKEMKEKRLSWFELVQRQGISEPVRKIESWSSEDLKRRRERPKIT